MSLLELLIAARTSIFIQPDTNPFLKHFINSNIKCHKLDDNNFDNFVASSFLYGGSGCLKKQLLGNSMLVGNMDIDSTLSSINLVLTVGSSDSLRS